MLSPSLIDRWPAAVRGAQPVAEPLPLWPGESRPFCLPVNNMRVGITTQHCATLHRPLSHSHTHSPARSRALAIGVTRACVCVYIRIAVKWAAHTELPT